MVPDELVKFLEGAFIEQEVDSFAGAELAFLMLTLAALGSAAFFRLGVALAKLCEAVCMVTMSGHGRPPVANWECWERRSEMPRTRCLLPVRIFSVV